MPGQEQLSHGSIAQASLVYLLNDFVNLDITGVYLVHLFQSGNYIG